MINIRQATKADCPQIRKTMERSFGPFEHLYTKSAYENTVVEHEELKRRMTEGVTWIAEEENQMLGTVSITFDKDWLYVTGMAVTPEAQGKKIGYRLLVALEEYAKEHQYKKLYLGTLAFLHRAIALYEGIGYLRKEDEPEWYGMPSIRYEKFL